MLTEVKYSYESVKIFIYDEISSQYPSLLEKFYLNLLHSSKTNIVRDIFIFPTEDVLSLSFKRKLQNINPRFILGKVTKFHKIRMSN